jgi:Uma2 family endonuclease
MASVDGSLLRRAERGNASQGQAVRFFITNCGKTMTHGASRRPIVARDPLPSPPAARHTMAMPALMPRIWTAAEVQALPDDPTHRYECVDGELLVSPTPRTLHQSAVTELALLLGPLVRSAGVGAIVCAPSDWVLDPRTLVQPDLYVVPLVEGRRPRTDEERGHPLLFIEILSPSTARFDRVVKRGRYQRAGIEYWIVDLDSRLIERWLPGDERPSIHAERVEWQPANADAPFVIALEPFFTEVLGPA